MRREPQRIVHHSPLALAALALGVLAGCAPEYTLELTTEAHGATLQAQQVTIPVGNAIGVTPLEDDEPLDADVEVELVSSAPHVMNVASSGAGQQFVLWGVAPGDADLEVFVDGELGGVIAVDVLPR